MRTMFHLCLLFAATVMGCEREESDDNARERVGRGGLGMEESYEIAGQRAVEHDGLERPTSPLKSRANLRWDPTGLAYLTNGTALPARSGGATVAIRGEPPAAGVGGTRNEALRKRMAENQNHGANWGHKVMAVEQEIIKLQEQIAISDDVEKAPLLRRLGDLFVEREATALAPHVP